MRTLIILVIGFLLWGVCCGIAKLVANASARSIGMATMAFVLIWFLVAAANMWIGVTKAGYTLTEELPVFLLIFLVPVATAIFAKWKFF